MCFLAYGLGLRHAVDADHIAAIDNVTRKLMQENQRPVAVGLFFSLGHSTIVILMSLLVVQGTGYVKSHFPEFQQVGGIIGTSISAFFLLLIAVVNLRHLPGGLQAFSGGAEEAALVRATTPCRTCSDGPGSVARRAPLAVQAGRRELAHVFRGLSVRLGFDTATEIALLGIAATQAAQQAPIWSIMVFPLLFTSGMCLLDTTDGIVMLGAYGWAFVKPVRKLFYNMTITLVSFVIALLIGSLEAINVLASKFHLEYRRLGPSTP